MQIAEILLKATAQISREDAEHLLLHVLGKSRGWLFAHDNDALDRRLAESFEALLARRMAGEPVAYITGQRGFWTLNLNVSPATLIPRPETELLVELALARWPSEAALQAADLGTGSGAIALALASERPAAQIIATDASAAALEVARHNAQSHAIGNVDFRHGYWYAPLAGERFDLILSNPPYIEADDAHLAQGDLRFEPRTALASGADGLHDLRHIVALAPEHLNAGGWLLLEHGWQQGAAVRSLLAAAGFSEVSTAQDLEQRERVSFGRWAGKQ
ncbi:protein-(glutamine-N5) methyltransferase, release factor-specific [Lysobacteraceae bacterium NML95-0200]|nr:protein-(glutamine-N5) methyltransferase, release factor-specific [Xanthomonadaceae bacterium NML95-0200]